ncbi:hypothetical protein [Bradyrhizobium sp. Tv2a-2]|uniref:hypothetical protein n=1 Tax=Bradyrhizobium sp. Tv2a-2 TaxID=113395 RepID=UPI000424AAC7|nr:hypothetical protein [Bradyrhizobium sp. Tv2a-2]
MLRFNANLFRIAFACASGEETRYYLQGVFVEPHPWRGVTLTATDGTRLVSIHDEHGKADEKAIVNLGDMLKQCKSKPGFYRVVQIGTGENSATLYEGDDPAAETSFKRVAVVDGVRVDGTYPDYRRVVPLAFKDVGAPAFQAEHLASFTQMARELALHTGWKPPRVDYNRDRKDALRILCSAEHKPETSPALILFPACDFAFGILMPVDFKQKETPHLPSWFVRREPIAQAAE